MIDEMNEMDNYRVDFNGKFRHYVSPTLVKSQNINKKDLARIKELHVMRLELYDQIAEAVVKYKYNIPSLMEQYTRLEFALQKIWGFPADETYHRFWDIPSCLCPKLDNVERIGTQYKIINQNCPLHGSI